MRKFTHFTFDIYGRRVRYWALLCLSLLAFGLYGQGTDLTEDEIKAAFLFNIPAFVNWPDKGNVSLTPLRYCTLHAAAVSDVLERLIAGDTLDGRPMELVRLADGQSPADCNILYTEGEDATAAGLLRDILSIGDSEAFLQTGGMVALVRRRNRIHPLVNLDAIDASPLVMSAKFLHLATRIRLSGGD